MQLPNELKRPDFIHPKVVHRRAHSDGDSQKKNCAAERKPEWLLKNVFRLQTVIVSTSEKSSHPVRDNRADLLQSTQLACNSAVPIPGFLARFQAFRHTARCPSQ